MPAVLCPYLIRKSSPPASLLFLFLLAGLSSTIALGRVRAGLEGRARAEGRVRSGVKNKSGDRASIEGNTETGFGDIRVSRPRAAAGEDVEEWGEPDTTTGYRSMLSIGEGGLWEPRSSSRCVPILSGMALCQNIGYDTMRMPNLLGHESPAEAVQQSASWLPLLARECHPDARIFLCSLFAPICLDRFISPCKSLCESVRDSCAPIMSCYGYPWPEILRCDQYPADHLMCISSITNSTVHTGGRRAPQASCRDCELEEASSSKDILETFCRSDFVLKLRLKRLKDSLVSLSQFSLAAKLDVLKHGPLLGGEIRSRIELWLERDATCLRNMTRHHPRGGTFLVTGTVQGERLVVIKAFAWHRRHKNLKAAARKWKHHRCRS
ncbi:secreted frizzled-related protein 5 [Pseudochaenichthys georgianus]|uniref:secreted frizzled-related protein 5 n=1 Tax=Pseudochaenichthys georgianus TaxID=52239 RepID=UPI00146CCF42|nr:secreted frizzled-related protein 5 [Pseudochaenichthys georgianus]